MNHSKSLSVLPRLMQINILVFINLKKLFLDLLLSSEKQRTYVLLFRTQEMIILFLDIFNNSNLGWGYFVFSYSPYSLFFVGEYESRF